MVESILSSLIQDWGGFEELVAQLHETGDVHVERDVILMGRSGAPRQIDVLLRHKVSLYENLIVIECKYWNTNVSRLHVDALATTVREVGGARGVMFSTAGFQSGAIAQAKHDNIDLFQIRELAEAEWGESGRFADLCVQVISLSIAHTQCPGAYADDVEVPSSWHLHLDFHDGAPGTPLVDEDITFELMLVLCARAVAKQKYKPLWWDFPDWGGEGELRGITTVKYKPPEIVRLRLHGGIVYVPEIQFTLGLSIQQGVAEWDRAKPYRFVLAVENVISSSVTLASRAHKEEKTRMDFSAEHSLGGSDKIYVHWAEGLLSIADFQGLKPGELKGFPLRPRD